MRFLSLALLYQIGPLVRLSTRRNLEILQEQSPSLTRAGTASSPPQFPRHHWDDLAPQETKSVHNPGPNKGPPSSASWVPPRGEMSRLTVWCQVISKVKRERHRQSEPMRIGREPGRRGEKGGKWKRKGRKELRGREKSGEWQSGRGGGERGGGIWV